MTMSSSVRGILFDWRGTGCTHQMGSEHLRYQRLSEADAMVAAHPGSLPLLPLGDLWADEAVAVALFDDLVERVANATNLSWDTDIYVPIGSGDRDPGGRAPRGARHPDGGRRGHARGRSRLLPGRQRRLADRPRAARLPVGLAR